MHAAPPAVEPSTAAPGGGAPPASSLSATAVGVSERDRLLASSSVQGTSLEKVGYSWEQTAHEVRIYLRVADCSDADLRCDFTKHSCALSVTLGPQRCASAASPRAAMPRLLAARTSDLHARVRPGRRYFFEIRRTFAPIDPTLSTAKVPRNNKQHVVLRLRKLEPDADWPALRCVDADLVVL